MNAVLGTFRFDRLDRYVVRYFFSSVFVVFVFFFGFFMVIDLVSIADEFVETATELRIAARTMVSWVAGYYLYKSPGVFLQVAPFVTVIGGIVAIARMNRSNELIPVLMSGRSIFRMLRPVFVCAGGLTLLMLVVQEFVAPKASDLRLAEFTHLCKGKTAIESKQVLTDLEGNEWSNMTFEVISQVMVRASVRRVTESRFEIINLENARYDAARGGWTMEGGILLLVHDASGATESRLDLLKSSLTPRQVTAQEKEPFDLSFAELGVLYGRTKQARWQVLLHYHITFPLTNLLLLLLAIPFVLRYDRQRVMQGLAIAFFLCVAYFGVDSALRTLGEYKLHPILAAWFAPLFFGALGISLFDGVRT